MYYIKKLSDKDWIRPGRPATDDEHEEMLAECETEYEAGLGMSIKEAKALTEKKLMFLSISFLKNK